MTPLLLPRKLVRFAMNGLKVLTEYRALMTTQYLAPADIEKIQKEKLKHILRVAVTRIPYYRDLKLDIDFENFSLNELKKFPIVDKNIIRSNYDLFLAKDTKLDHLEWKKTSGSSGKPFKVPKHYYSDAIEGATQFRAFSMGGEIYRPRDPLLVLRTYSPQPGDPVYKHDPIRNYWYLSPFDINQKNLNLYLEVLKRSRSKFLKGYASSIYIFTLLLKENNIPRPAQIRTIITSSESMLPIYRKTIEDYWGIPVLDWYGQNERTVTVQQCAGGNYHNNDEYGILELDAQNRIIATSLNNDVMPLIRYNTNDVAVPLGPNESPSCKNCKRGLKVAFKAVDGRSDDIILKPDGTRISSVNVYTAMESFDRVKQFKITQRRNYDVEILLVELAPMDSTYLTALRQSLAQRFGELELKINVVDEIPRDLKTNKVKAIESELAKEVVHDHSVPS